MSYLVLARKWRPQTFKDLVGQEAVNKTLENAISKDRIAHAFLFSGVRGVGKTSSARLLAKSLNCEKGPTVDPCCKCSSCVEIATSTSLDVMEIDAASNTGVDNVRELRENARYAPSRDRFKIYIIDEVHMLSISAFNALLKTLEEPPDHVKFILATTELHKIPVTILSRCQHFEFRRIAVKKIEERLRNILDGEKISIEDGAMDAITKAADGSLRDAISILDQVIAFSDKEIRTEDVEDMLGIIDKDLVTELTASVIKKDSAALMALVGRLVEQGYDIAHFCTTYLEHIRDLLMVRISEKPEELVTLSDRELENLRELSKELSEDDLIRFFDVISDAENRIKWSKVPRFILEMALVKLIQLKRLKPIEEFIDKLGAGVVEVPKGVAVSPRTEATLSEPDSSENGEKAGISEVKTESAEENEATEKQSDDVLSKILALLEKKKPMLLSFVKMASNLSLEDDVLTICFDSESDFPYEKVSDSENFKIIENIVQSVTGNKVKLKVQKTSSVSGEDLASSVKKEGDERAEIESKAASEPLVQKVVELFHGKITDIDKID